MNREACNINKITEDLMDLRRKIKKESSIAFAKASKSFFETYPEIEEIKWSQYTPYFNDGDSCEFSIGEVYFIPKDLILPDGVIREDLGIWDWEEYAYTSYSREVSDDIGKVIKDMTSMLEVVEDFLHETFGDHVIVTMNKTGATTEAYEHD